MQENLVGTTIDNRYRILEQVGAGGMGTVYKASLVGPVSRIVALKLIDKNAVGDKDSRERFLREGKSLASLSHPNIVTFYHFGMWKDSRPYIAMELVQGRDLARILGEQTRLPWKQAIKIAIQCCSAMSFAHDNNIINRDLKPQNIMLLDSSSGEPHVKVIDFGLCKLTNESVDKLTQTGIIIGSLYYMSPEQCQGSPSTKQSDVYSLGCILYELLTGSQPLSDDTALGVLRKHVHELPARFAEVAPGIAFPRGLENCVFKAMAKLPIDRYQSMKELSDDLSLILNEKNNEISADTMKVFVSPSGKRNPLIGIVIGAAVLISGVAVVLSDYTQCVARSNFYRYFDGQNARSDCLSDAWRMAKVPCHSGAMMLCRTAVNMPTGSNVAAKDAEFYCRAAEIALLCDAKPETASWIERSLKRLTEFITPSLPSIEESQLLARVCAVISECDLNSRTKLIGDLERLEPNLSLPSDRILPLQLILKHYQLAVRFNLREIAVSRDLAYCCLCAGKPKEAYEVLAPLLQAPRYKDANTSSVRGLFLQASAQKHCSKHEYAKAVPELEKLIELTVQNTYSLAPYPKLIDDYRMCLQQTNSSDRDRTALLLSREADEVAPAEGGEQADSLAASKFSPCVRRLYFTLFSRQPDIYAQWAEEEFRIGIPYRQIVHHAIDFPSGEFKRSIPQNPEEAVVYLYKRVLGRSTPASKDEIALQSAVLRKEGVDAVIHSLLSSPEFESRFPSRRDDVRAVDVFQHYQSLKSDRDKNAYLLDVVETSSRAVEYVLRTLDPPERKQVTDTLSLGLRGRMEKDIDEGALIMMMMLGPLDEKDVQAIVKGLSNNESRCHYRRESMARIRTKDIPKSERVQLVADLVKEIVRRDVHRQKK